MWQSIIAFFSMVALDFLWAKYNIACTEKKAAYASSLAALILGLSAFVVMTYVDNPWMLLPAIAGSFVGTFIAIKFSPGA